MAEPAYAPLTRESLAEVAALMRAVFPRARKFTVPYLDWLYFQNPVGEAFGFNIVDAGQVVGHVAALPQRLELKGQAALGALMVNGATSEAVRGRGLYLRLIQHMVEAAGRRGFAAVTGVANQNTIRAYETKLGFQNVAGLDAYVSLKAERIDAARASDAAQYRQLWDDASLVWRMRNPDNPLRIAGGAGGALVVEGASTAPLVRARAVIPRATGMAAPGRPASPWPAVSLGLAPEGCVRRPLSLPVPDRLRPSPLRLIYRNAADPADRLDPRRILFSFLDFDAF